MLTPDTGPYRRCPKCGNTFPLFSISNLREVIGDSANNVAPKDKPAVYRSHDNPHCRPCMRLMARKAA